LNIPAPLIQLFLTDYPAIFGEEVPEEKQSPIREMHAMAPPSASDAIRSPRHQMFSDLPTPAYNQSGFGQQAALPGFQPLAPMSSQPNRNTYAPRSQFGDSGFPAPPVYQTGGASEFASLNALSQAAPSEGVGKKSRRESSMMGTNYGLVNQRQTSRHTLRDTSSSRIPEAFESFAQQQRNREATPERRYQQQTTLF
jgi:RalA-binding protein 1